MDSKEIFAKLKEPFHPEDLEWRVQSSGIGTKGPWIQVLTYVTARAIMDRLDDVVGPDKWKCSYLQVNGGFLCELSIKFGDEWISKQDGSDASDVEPFKGGISGAIKRAAVPWGIGRYLYQLETGFATVSKEFMRGAHKALIKDKKTGQEAWVYWLPPELPEWALPPRSANNKMVKEQSLKTQEGLKQRLGQERENPEGLRPAEAQQGQAGGVLEQASGASRLQARAEEIKKEIISIQTFADLGNYWFENRKEIENLPVLIRDEIIALKDKQKRLFQ